MEKLTLIALPDYVDRDEAEDLSFGSLVDFFVLKRIYLRAANLPRPNDSPLVGRLPPSLASLCITDSVEVDTRVLAKRLRDLISVAREQFPHLDGLRIENTFHQDEYVDWADEDMYEE